MVERIYLWWPLLAIWYFLEKIVTIISSAHFLYVLVSSFEHAAQCCFTKSILHIICTGMVRLRFSWCESMHMFKHHNTQLMTKCIMILLKVFGVVLWKSQIILPHFSSICIFIETWQYRTSIYIIGQLQLFVPSYLKFQILFFAFRELLV